MGSLLSTDIGPSQNIRSNYNRRIQYNPIGPNELYTKKNRSGQFRSNALVVNTSANSSVYNIYTDPVVCKNISGPNTSNITSIADCTQFVSLYGAYNYCQFTLPKAGTDYINNMNIALKSMTNRISSLRANAGANNLAYMSVTYYSTFSPDFKSFYMVARPGYQFSDTKVPATTAMYTQIYNRIYPDIPPPQPANFNVGCCQSFVASQIEAQGGVSVTGNSQSCNVTNTDGSTTTGGGTTTTTAPSGSSNNPTAGPIINTIVPGATQAPVTKPPVTNKPVETTPIGDGPFDKSQFSTDVFDFIQANSKDGTSTVENNNGTSGGIIFGFIVLGAFCFAMLFFFLKWVFTRKPSSDRPPFTGGLAGEFGRRKYKKPKVTRTKVRRSIRLRS